MDPLDTERRFRNLLRHLSYPSSPRQRLLAIAAFVDSLEFHPESYLVELGQHLPRIMERMVFEGLDPARLNALLKKLESLRQSHVPLSSVNGFAHAVRLLRRAVAAQFACVGEMEEALAVLEPGRGAVSHRAGTDLAPRETLDRALEEAKAGNSRIAAELEDIAREWSARSSVREGTAVIPVVEHALMEDSQKREGSLRRIEFTLLGGSPEDKDSLHTDVSVFGAHSNASELVEKCIRAARSLIPAGQSALRRTYLHGRISFEREHALHRGSSANLALSALLYCGILRRAGQRQQVNLTGSAAITGDVDERGNVLPVDPGGLSLKVHAAFFSWIEVLVVPEPQVPDAVVEAECLSRRYPRRRLEIIGVQHLRELFYDRRVTVQKPVPLPVHVVRRLWAYRSMIALGVFLVLAGVIFRLWYGPLDRNPAGYRFEGEMLYLENKDGQVVDGIHVGRSTVEGANAAEEYRIRAVDLADADKDGENEVYWGQYDKPELSGMTIRSKKIGENAARWSFPLSRRLSFRSTTDVTGSEFLAKLLRIDDLEGDGRADLLVIAKHAMFPSLVVRLDAATGKETAHYLHMGHLTDFVVADLDGDGVKEVVLSGANNALKTACLVVLDAGRMGGHSPLSPAYAPEGYAPAAERAYVLLPRTTVSELYRKQVRYNHAPFVRISERDSTIIVHVHDLHVSGGSPEDRITSTIWIHFGFDLRVRDVATGDDFDALYDYHVSTGDLPDIPRAEYLREYKKTLRYWNGAGWAESPIRQHEAP